MQMCNWPIFKFCFKKNNEKPEMVLGNYGKIATDDLVATSLFMNSSQGELLECLVLIWEKWSNLPKEAPSSIGLLIPGPWASPEPAGVIFAAICTATDAYARNKEEWEWGKRREKENVNVSVICISRCFPYHLLLCYLSAKTLSWKYACMIWKYW